MNSEIFGKFQSVKSHGEIQPFTIILPRLYFTIEIKLCFRTMWLNYNGDFLFYMNLFLKKNEISIYLTL